MKVLSGAFKWAHKNKRQIAEIGIGLSIYEFFNFLYDMIAYPLALAYFGLAKGAALMWTGSLVSCAFLFWLYERQKIDWLGAKMVQDLDQGNKKNRVTRLLTWIGREKKTRKEKVLNVLAFVLLNSWIDPLIVAVHFRTEHFNGIKSKDWGILFGAVFAANFWWTLKSGLLVTAAKWLWTRFAHGG